MLVLIHVLGLAAAALGTPQLLVTLHRNDLAAALRSEDVAGPLGAHDVIGHVRRTARLLPARTEELDAVGILVNHRMMVEDVAVHRLRPHLPSAAAGGADG